MSSRDIIEKVNKFLGEFGIKEGQDFMWSLQGPTIVPFSSGEIKLKSLRESDRREVKKMGAYFLI